MDFLAVVDMWGAHLPFYKSSRTTLTEATQI